MKQLATTILIVITFYQAFAQSNANNQEGMHLKDSVIKTQAHFGYGVRVSQKDVYKYNLNNLVKLNDKFTNIHWFTDSIDWKKTEKTHYTYANQNTLTQMIREKRAVDAEDWVNDYKLVYTNNQGDLVKTSHDWENNSWQQSGRWINSWNPTNFESSQLMQRWNNNIGEWENYRRKDTIFTMDGMFDTIKLFIWFSPNVMDTGFIEAFDYSYYPDTIFSYVTQNNSNDIIKQYHDNNLNANVELTYRNIGDTNNYRPFLRKLYYLDENQNIISYMTQSWDVENCLWNTFSQFDYHYNFLNLLYETLYYLLGDTTYPFRKTTYAYNSEYLVSKRVVYNEPANPDEYTMHEYYYTLRYVDIFEEAISQQTKAYPNPAQSLVFIDNSKLTYRHYKVYDFSGKLVQSGKLHQENKFIDISALPTGNYVLSLQGINTTYSQQLIKLR